MEFVVALRASCQELRNLLEGESCGLGNLFSECESWSLKNDTTDDYDQELTFSTTNANEQLVSPA